MFCAPDRQNGTSSCLDVAELRSLAAHYNKVVGLDPIPLNSFESAISLVTDLGDRLNSVCDADGKSKGDHCWIEQKFVKMSDMYSQLQKNFLPLKPSSWKANEKEWLNTYDILNAMRPYERKYKDFQFLGAFPSDFSKTSKADGSCIIQSMCQFEITKFIASGKKRFGIVINLDKHNQPGSHWVACSCCLDQTSPQYGICYFDSGGKKPQRDVIDFIKNVKLQMETRMKGKGMGMGMAATGHQPRFKFNHEQKQFRNTECGVFAMLFLITCLQNQDKTYKSVRAMIVSDKQDKKIHAFRNKFYRE